MSTSTMNNKNSRNMNYGPVPFFVSLFIFAIGLIQLFSTFHMYALSYAEYNDLKKQESSLLAQRATLENNMKRWDDNSYVITKARERLGFSFPGETTVRVENSQSVTGTQKEQNVIQQNEKHSTLPWYSELSYSIKKVDDADHMKNSQK
ncbi:MAG: septum formation initiator family protein [Bifidobacteriaceae bacterium]|nr:septum formation initiator family protein [Bifidobacteriaceae bacterium]